jgi:RNA polymerase sigma-70 factor, ECF subfamily
MPSLEQHSAGTALSPPDRQLADLLGAAAQQDDIAFAELYRLTSGRLHALARRMVGAARAGDALQEAYLRVWTHAARYDASRGTPLQWMAAITRNYCLSMLRVEPLLADDWDSVEISVFAAPDSVYDLQRCLNTLDARERHCLELSFLHGYSHTELEERLSMKLGTLKSIIRRALIRLRACLDATPGAAEDGT